MTAPRRGRVVVVGSINADLVLTVERHPSPGETVLGGGGEVLPGGKGANQAVAAARQGARVAMVGAVGDDANAGPATSQLSRESVDLSAVSTVPGPTGLAVVTVSADGENSIVVVPGANASVLPDRVAQQRAVLEAAALIVLQGELPRATVEAAAHVAVAAGTRLLLNLAPAIDLDPSCLLAADPLVVNEHEAAHALVVLGVQAAAAQEIAPVDLGVSLTTTLVRAGARSVVVTLGGAGAVVGEHGSVGRDLVTHLPAPRVEVVDTTGAGDAFVGALAARLAVGEDLVGAARTAVRIGAFAVQRQGAQPSYPSREDRLP